MESFDNNLEQNKKEKWEAATKAVESIVDGLGKHIDGGIKEAVVSIKVHGFGTMGSCEGHLDRGLPYPWIDIGSQLAEKDKNHKSRFKQLWDAHVQEVQGGDKMPDAERVELQELIDLQISANKEAFARFEELLDEFYQSGSDENVKLRLRGDNWGRGRLQPANVPTGLAKAIMEELSKLSEEEMANNLDAYRKEMDRFAEFLKSKFFDL